MEGQKPRGAAAATGVARAELSAGRVSSAVDRRSPVVLLQIYGVLFPAQVEGVDAVLQLRQQLRHAFPPRTEDEVDEARLDAAMQRLVTALKAAAQ